MTPLRTCLALATSLAVAFPALAQDAGPPESDPEIVVEGQREVDGAEARDQAREVTERPGSYSEPLARFQREVCPGVWGLAPENAQAVIDRIYDNAERADIAIDANPGCAANMWVIVVDDPQAEFAKLQDERSYLVSELTKRQREQVEEDTGPALAWNIVSTRNREGMPIATGFDAVTNRMRNPAEGQQVFAMSRLSTGIRKDIELSIVMIRRSELARLDAYAIADYASMRALALTEPPEQGAAFDTVLALFDGTGTAPDRLTSFDRAYLRSVYRGSETRPSNQALGDIGYLMEEDLEERE
ncbi:hypothetical protein [Aurantiacibacter spongiae]|uniref:DUF2927 domain-containing protein n=1 Tax=Aurantiacibacter spongiae TaxID=2488860 RepID=A0A3N5CV75_9SPHN|nr:hypothetical protein [Aurantiacibacter spongiae]RPF72246.1 hypothetical protein EG799_11880 [Aurantiacibacter spongiae]